MKKSKLFHETQCNMSIIELAQIEWSVFVRKLHSGSYDLELETDLEVVPSIELTESEIETLASFCRRYLQSLESLNQPSEE